MPSFDAVDHYYSGQGVVMLAQRNADGTPKGLVPVGNVSDLKLSVSTSTLEHKESHSGQRATDLRITTETKVALSMTMENFSSSNLAQVLRGTRTEVLGGTVTGEAVKGYLGAVTALANIKVSAVAVKRGITALTAYTNDTTPFDYKANLDAGSIQINDGSVALVDKLTTGGAVPTAVTVGATTSVTVANTASAGDKVVFTGFAGADAALLNGKAFTILTATAAGVTLNLDTSGKTITIGTPLAFFDGKDLTVDYTFADQYRVDAMDQGVKELYMRFEGLNTADDNAPVVVDVFKFTTDPLKELALISDGVQNFVLEGSVLADSTRTTGSKFFKQKLLR